jgi:nucleotide-binding universal stress UspA family protein
MKKILLALDGSENDLKSVRFAGNLFSGKDDIEIVLCYVLPPVPAVFWDDGHILTRDEKKAREGIVEKWISNQTLKLDNIIATAKGILVSAGMQTGQVATRKILDSLDVAGSICEEARDGEYQMLIVGRGGRSDSKERLGSTAEKIARHGAGITICIVE